jgi:hypothetical protein
MPVVGSLSPSQQVLIDRATYLDPIQGDVADCYLISSMISLAWTTPAVLEARLKLGGFTTRAEQSFTWQFHDAQGGTRGRIKVSGDVPVKRTGLPIYARSDTQDEYWPSLIEKAYVVATAKPNGEPTPAHYQSLRSGTTPQDACQALVGGSAQGEVLDRPDDLNMFSVDHELKLIDREGITTRPVMAWTKTNLGTDDREEWKRTGLWPGHAYAVLGIMSSGHFVLRNPHGFPTERRRGYSEEDQWLPAGRDAVQLNQAGVFALSPELFLANFGNLGWLDQEPAIA